MKKIKAKDNAAVIGKAEGKQQFFGGTHTHNEGNQSQKTTISTNLITLPPNRNNWVERKEEIERIKEWLNDPQVTTVGITQAKTVGIQGLGGVGKSTLAAYVYQDIDFEAKFWADVSLKPDFTVFAEKIILAFGGEVTQRIDITELINNLLYLLNQRRCLLVVDNLETLLDEESNWQSEYYQANLKSNLKEPESWKSLILEDVSEYLEIIDHRCELEQYVAANKILDNKDDKDYSCYKFLHLRGYYGVLVEIYEKLVQGWQSNLQPEERADYANYLNNLGIAYGSQGEYQQAIDYLQQSLKIKQDIGDRNTKAKSLHNLGLAYKCQGKCQRAIDYYQQSLEITREIGDRQREAKSLIGLGNAYKSLGEYPRAIEFHQQSLEITRAIGDRQGEATSLMSLGNVYSSQGEYQRAIENYQQSLEIQQEIGDRNGEAKSLNNLGLAYKCQGKCQRAIENYQHSLAITEEIGDRNGIAISLNNLGIAYHSQGEYQLAIKNHQESLQITRDIGYRQGEAYCLNNLGDTYNSQGESPRAIDYLQQSLKIKRDISDRYGEAYSLNSLGDAYNNLGEYQQARDYLQQSLEISQQIGTRNLEAESWFNLGDTRKNLQQKSEAKTAYENSRELYQAMELDKKVEECDKAIQDLENNNTRLD